MYLILGLARSGLAAAVFLQQQGEAFVVFDDYKNDLGYPLLKECDWSRIKTVVMSPGIALSHPSPHPLVDKAFRQRCEIITDCTLLQRFAPDKRYIGITGTNGKSTITALITHVLRACGVDAVMGGNIGVPALELALNHDVYVLELSSFQLERSPPFDLDVAVWTNLTEDHLAQHGTMEQYRAAKKRIFKKAVHKVISTDDAYSLKVADAFPDALRAALADPVVHLLVDHLYLKGDHNKQNRLIAYYALKAFGLDHDTILQGIQTFKGLKHRQQCVARFGAVTFINDSKATSAVATEQALKAFDAIHWLVGGQDKSDGIDSLIPYFRKVKKAYVFGAARERFSRVLAVHKVNFSAYEDMDEALTSAYEEATREKDTTTILLSPACASFDQYKDFEARGDHFIQLIEQIKCKESSLQMKVS